MESAWSLSRAIKRSSSVDEIYQSADYITVHVPLTDATRGMFSAASIAQMKDGVHLLNFSRAETGRCAGPLPRWRAARWQAT